MSTPDGELPLDFESEEQRNRATISQTWSEQQVLVCVALTVMLVAAVVLFPFDPIDDKSSTLFYLLILPKLIAKCLCAAEANWGYILQNCILFLCNARS
jgi:hypothetical protein